MFLTRTNIGVQPICSDFLSPTIASFLSRYSSLSRSLKKIRQRKRREFRVSLKGLSTNLVEH